MEQAGPGRAALGSPVRDLGVVGRGKKRINLAATGTEPAGSSAAGAVGDRAVKKKRSLEDLMGGPYGVGSTAGFSAAVPAASDVGRVEAATPAAPAAAPCAVRAPTTDASGGEKERQ